MKNSQNESNILDELEENFFEFIEAASKLGKVARTEESHSNGVGTKQNADDAIQSYSKLIKEVNNKFNIFKEKSNIAHNGNEKNNQV